MTTDKNPMADSISGARVRSGHRASLFGILGSEKMIDIQSGGVHFAMLGHFPYRMVLTKVAEHCHTKGAAPTARDFQIWAEQIWSEGSRIQPRIQIAETGDLLTRRAYMALIGGANHEGFHRLYSGQGVATGPELAASVLAGFKVGVPYHKYAHLLAEAQNIFEDVRIERIGCAEFPGVYTKMADLTDFVLDQETPCRKQDLVRGAPPARVALSVIREVGLGYNTIKTREALAHYRLVAPEIVDLLLKGVLAPLMRAAIPDVSTPKAIAHAKVNTGFATTLALRFLTALHDLSLTPPPSLPQQGKPSKSQSQNDSQKSSENESKSKESKSNESDSQESSEDKSKGSKSKKKSDETEDTDPDDSDEDTSKSESDSDENSDESDSDDDSDESDSDENTSKGKNDSDEDDSENDSDEDDSDESNSKSESDSDKDSDESDSDDEGESDSDDEGEGSDSEGNDSDDDSDEGASGNDSDEGSDGSHETSDLDDEADPGGEGAGGTAPEDLGETAADILNSLTNGMKDYASALEAAVKEALKDEIKSLLPGERPYRPFSTENDKIEVVSGNAEAGRQAIRKLVTTTKRETSYLRSKLRSMFRALENNGRLHGVRKGQALSERFLVDTLATIRAGQDPARAFHEDTVSLDTSIAACIVIDESGSMKKKLTDTSAILYTLGESLDSIDAKFSMVGFRCGHDNSAQERYSEEVKGASGTSYYHRGGDNIIYDVFKNFDERFKSVSWRLGNVRAAGGTPMADGVEFALNALSTRREGHRILFVVTDGRPDEGHLPIIYNQIRRAREAGIHFIGIGLGYESTYVQTTFEDSVHANSLGDIPVLLVNKLQERVRKIGTSKRGLKVKVA